MLNFSDFRYETLVGGVINWLNNLAQSNQQMDIDNDWAISLQVSRTAEVPKGFGKGDGFEPEIIKENDSSNSIFSQESLSITVPRLRNDDMDILPGDENEEERLFGVISGEEDDEDNDDVVSEGGGEDYFDKDNGTFTVFKNKVALDVLVDKEILTSNKITDYYELGRVQDTPLRGECLLIAFYAHHVY